MLYNVSVKVTKIIVAENEKQAQDAVTSKLNYFDYFDSFSTPDVEPVDDDLKESLTPDEQ